MSEFQFSEEDFIKTLSEVEPPFIKLGSIFHDINRYLCNATFILSNNKLSTDEETYEEALEQYTANSHIIQGICQKKNDSVNATPLNSPQEISLLGETYSGLILVSEWYNAFFKNHSEDDKLVKQMNSTYEPLMYSINKNFSKNFKKDYYIFNKDLAIFYTNLYTINPSKRGLEGMLDIELDETIKTYDDCVFDIIKPIIDNALDHGKCSTINISGNELTPQLYSISISNNGKKVNSEDIDKIFINGFTTREIKDNHGIGLSHVKYLVERNGGTISVKSSNKETSFEFTIPCVQEAEGYYVQIKPKN